MQLIAGRTAQEFNGRKGHQGAFWEDRYHATAIEVDEHLARCVVYIDLNMVRAGVVKHPSEWVHGGYRELQAPPKRYAIIDLGALNALCGFSQTSPFQGAHRKWVTEALRHELGGREDRWSEAVAVGSSALVEWLRKMLTGWTFQFYYPYDVAALSLVAAIGLCLAAGYAPAKKAAATPIIAAIGYE